MESTKNLSKQNQEKKKKLCHGKVSREIPLLLMTSIRMHQQIHLQTNLLQITAILADVQA